MAIGLAFVDIVGDTTRTGPQVERAMERVLAVVEESLDPLDIQAAVDAGTERDLTREMNADIRAAQAAIQAIQVDARIGPETQRRLEDGLRNAIAQTRARVSEIEVRVANRPIVESTVEAVREAVHVAEAVAPPIEIETRVDNDRLSRGLASIGSMASSALGPLVSLGTAAVSLGTAAPAIAGVAAAVASMAPAGAVAAPAILTVVAATGALKLGMLGISDAVTAAFDTAHPEKFDEALKGLAPNAQSFVKEIAGLKPVLKDLQQSVQNELFRELDTSLKETADSVLPVLKAKLTDTASAFGDMAGGVLKAGSELGTSGTLGKALDSSNTALSSLSQIPGQLLTAFVQLGAAAGPALERMASAISRVAEGASGQLSKAFESGALQKGIEGGIAQVKLLFGALGNVAKIFGDINNVASQFGGGTLGTFKALTGEIEKFTSSSAFQDALKSFFSAVQDLTGTALPLLGQALMAIGPVIQSLLPGVQALIAALGPALSQVIAALAPVLLAAGQAISAIAVAAAPLITLLGQLISAVLPVLTPLLNAVTLTFQLLAPLIAQVAQIFASAFLPVLTTLITAVLPPLVQIFTTVVSAILPVFAQLLTALTPALITMSNAFASLATAIAPLIEIFAVLLSKYLQVLVPILMPIIDFVGKLASVLADTLAQLITTVVVPALNVVTALLKGDFSTAWQNAKQVVRGAIDFMIQIFVNLPSQVGQLMLDLGSALWNGAQAAFGRFKEAAIEKIENDFFPWVANLRFRIIEKIGNLGNTLFSAGREVIQGFIDGVQSRIPSLSSLLSSITNMIPQLKGPPARDRVLLTPAGKLIMDGLIDGINFKIPALENALGNVTGIVGGARMGLQPADQRSMRAQSSASRIAQGAALGMASAAAPNIQIFVGDREITDIVDVRIASANRGYANQVRNGMRR